MAFSSTPSILCMELSVNGAWILDAFQPLCLVLGGKGTYDREEI